MNASFLIFSLSPKFFFTLPFSSLPSYSKNSVVIICILLCNGCMLVLLMLIENFSRTIVLAIDEFVNYFYLLPSMELWSWICYELLFICLNLFVKFCCCCGLKRRNCMSWNRHKLQVQFSFNLCFLIQLSIYFLSKWNVKWNPVEINWSNLKMI